ncbi:FAD-dependent oxidoreductase [Streptomyces sp. VRA16 Mangrove soil]|uniref:FAD-dependent oxidoreductase n=1 Tax=Streptomyces sp. VRA16 Mangrove soil TaxID=2817434 RepID=UPI001A9EFAF3|nr:FAD-dependent oxidoreductase [Streptomyces sp. VRA16 Mangrove soil]MBO1332156.1 FAD-dependent oxidoreductase [Streptomyces sp. VRA16 Mangrove soil]
MTVTRTGPLPTLTYDIAVVGAGVVGCALARELVRRAPGARIALLDAADDIGEGTSKANTAILHTGFDAVPGSLEARLVREGGRMLADYAAQSGIPLEPLGALLIAWDADQLAALPGLAAKAARNGHHATRPLPPDELRAREPHLGPGALGALDVPGESIICPWTTTLAYAEQAVRAGVDLHLNSPVRRVRSGTGTHRLTVTGRGTLTTRWLVNAAGLHADTVDRMLGHDTFTVTPRRGQLIVYDTFARDLVQHILLPVPTALGKGVLVTPTVHGHVLLGPTAEDLHGDDAKDATHTTADALDRLRAQGRRILPRLTDEEPVAAYAGLRAATGQDDYRITARPRQHYVTVGGIRSTGLTASMGIAVHVADLLADSGCGALGAPRDLPPVTMPNLGEAFPRPYQRPELIARDPEFGVLLCHCERVTRAEIRAALTTTIPPASLAGLRRRTRAGAGRCQGAACGAAVRELFGRGGGMRG